MPKAAEVAAPTITLTPDELHALTGYRRPDEQLRAFLDWFAGQVLRRIEHSQPDEEPMNTEQTLPVMSGQTRPVEAPPWIGEALRQRHGLSRPKRYPLVGDIVEVDGVIGICTEYSKGWCYVRQLSDDAPWLDFISDEPRHGPCGKTWRIRDDL